MPLTPMDELQTSIQPTFISSLACSSFEMEGQLASIKTMHPCHKMYTRKHIKQQALELRQDHNGVLQRQEVELYLPGLALLLASMTGLGSAICKIPRHNHNLQIRMTNGMVSELHRQGSQLLDRTRCGRIRSSPDTPQPARAFHHHQRSTLPSPTLIRAPKLFLRSHLLSLNPTSDPPTRTTTPSELLRPRMLLLLI